MNTPNQWQLSGNAAERYERVLVPAIFAPWAADLVALAKLRPGERVLDVACGTGVVGRLAAERVGPKGHVTGLDLNESMLEVARSRGVRVEIGRRVESLDEVDADVVVVTAGAWASRLVPGLPVRVTRETVAYFNRRGAPLPSIGVQTVPPSVVMTTLPGKTAKPRCTSPGSRSPRRAGRLACSSRSS